MVYVDKGDGSGPMRLRSQVGRPVDLHTAGVGKVILAHLESPLQQELLKTVTYRALTPTSITDPDELRRQLDEILARGWAEDDGEGESYVNCVALPIYDATGLVRSGMSVTALREIAPLPELRSLLPRFRDVSHAISATSAGASTPPARPNLKPSSGLRVQHLPVDYPSQVSEK